MLTITDQAVDVLRKIPAQPMLPTTAGLRISRRSGAAADAPLAVGPAHEPLEGDRVLEDDGARVFLGRHAAELLDDHILDVRLDESGRLEFSVTAA